MGERIRAMSQREMDVLDIGSRLDEARERGRPVTLPQDLAQRITDALRDGERLRLYRDDHEARVRGEVVADGEPLTQSDADYLRVLGSYGSRVCQAGWFYAYAARIEATIRATPTPDAGLREAFRAGWDARFYAESTDVDPREAFDRWLASRTETDPT